MIVRHLGTLLIALLALIAGAAAFLYQYVAHASWNKLSVAECREDTAAFSKAENTNEALFVSCGGFLE